MSITLAIVDDHPELISIISANLELYQDIEIVLTAFNGRHFFDKLGACNPRPQLVLMDIDMPEMNGVEAVELLRDTYPEIKVIMLTVFDDEEKIFDAIHAGANGYLLKDVKPAKMVAAIEDALEGGVPMSPSVANKTLNLLLKNSPKNLPKIEPAHYKLSEREVQVLKLLATGKAYQAIAEILFISPKTVRGHIEKIYEKLHVHSKLEAVQLAQKNRWL